MARLGRPGMPDERRRWLWDRWSKRQSISEVGRDLGDGPRPLPSELDGPATELWRMRTRHLDSFPEVLSPQYRCPAKRGRLSGNGPVSA